MSNESRTSKSLKNAQVSLFYYAVQLFLGFFSRKVFFDYLGSEVLGLNTTASNLLGFLNLAELGIGMSIGYFLYRPLYEGDTERLNKIVALQGWIYRRVATFIIAAACLLMLFFPKIFESTPLPLWYAYVTFGVLLFSAMLGYFVNFREIVLQADQKSYKVQRITQGAIAIKTILQIVGMQFVPFPFLFWTGTEFVFAIISACILNYVLKKEYPWLHPFGYNGRALVREFPDIITKTKQVFVHKCTSVVSAQCAPLIIYAFSSLTTVAYYGNYVLIVGKAVYLMQMVFNSTGAGIGNLIAAGNKDRILEVFWELFDSRLCISMSLLFSIYFVIQPFITIWLGAQYLLSDWLLFLLMLTSAININTTTAYSYLGGYGLYKDVWATITEMVLNLSCSLLFGWLLGFEGVLVGVLLSQLVIVCLWKPYFLFTQGFNISPKRYFVPVAWRLLLLTANFMGLAVLFHLFPCVSTSGYVAWGLTSLGIFILIASLLFAQFYFLTDGMKAFVTRMRKFI